MPQSNDDNAAARRARRARHNAANKAVNQGGGNISKAAGKAGGDIGKAVSAANKAKQGLNDTRQNAHQASRAGLTGDQATDNTTAAQRKRAAAQQGRQTGKQAGKNVGKAVGKEVGKQAGRKAGQTLAAGSAGIGAAAIPAAEIAGKQMGKIAGSQAGQRLGKKMGQKIAEEEHERVEAERQGRRPPSQKSGARQAAKFALSVTAGVFFVWLFVGLAGFTLVSAAAYAVLDNQLGKMATGATCLVDGAVGGKSAICEARDSIKQALDDNPETKKDIEKYIADDIRFALDCNNTTVESRAKGECIENAMDQPEDKITPMPARVAWRIPIYKKAAEKYDLPWQLLAAVHATRNNFGVRNCYNDDRKEMGDMRMPEELATNGKILVDGGSTAITKTVGAYNCYTTTPPAKTTPDDRASVYDGVDSIYTQANLLSKLGAKGDKWEYNGEALESVGFDDVDGPVYLPPAITSGTICAGINPDWQKIMTKGQLTFISEVSRLSGINSLVIAAQVFNEMNGTYAATREREGNHNWLNIAYFDSGAGELTRDPVWNNPQSAAKASVDFFKGLRFGASDGIQNAYRQIMADGGKDIDKAFRLIGESGWATSQYNNGGGPGSSLLAIAKGPLGGKAGEGTSCACQANSSSGAASTGPIGYPLDKEYKVIQTPEDHAKRALGNWQSDNALDFDNPRNTPVLAVEDGTITRVSGSKPKEGCGKICGVHITLKSSGNQYFYTHLMSASVKSGDKVKKGDQIGKSGFANGVDHLHIGVEKGDPMALWGKGGGNCSSTDPSSTTGNRSTTIIGDSITDMSRGQLKKQIPGVKIYAQVNKHMAQDADSVHGGPSGLTLLKRNREDLGHNVVIALGTNDESSTTSQFKGWIKKARKIIGASHNVILVTVTNNGAINKAIKETKGVSVADWKEVADLSGDNIHPTPAGQKKFAKVIADQVKEEKSSLGFSSGSKSSGSSDASSSDTSSSPASSTASVSGGKSLGTFETTAYGPPWGGTEGGTPGARCSPTSTGVTLCKGEQKLAVAVNPKVIPYGTKLKINPNPFKDPNLVFTAVDTGGHGDSVPRWIDFFIADDDGGKRRDAWGRKDAKVYEVGKGKPKDVATLGQEGSTDTGTVSASLKLTDGCQYKGKRATDAISEAVRYRTADSAHSDCYVGVVNAWYEAIVANPDPGSLENNEASSELRDSIVRVANEEAKLNLKEKGCEDCGPPAERYKFPEGSPWCAFFSTWVYKKAGVAIGNLNSVSAWEDMGRQKNLYKEGPTNDPQPGDVALIGSSHMEIVVEVKSPREIVLVGGNTSDQVLKHTVDPTAYRITGYVSPPGAGAGTMGLEQVQAGDKYVSPSYGPFTIDAENAKNLVWWHKGKVAVAKWMVPQLIWAKGQGWDGQITNGFRAAGHQRAIYSTPGACNPCADPGKSNHEGSAYPRGAIDVANWGQFKGIIARYPGEKKLVWYGPGDVPHFSHDGG